MDTWFPDLNLLISVSLPINNTCWTFDNTADEVIMERISENSYRWASEPWMLPCMVVATSGSSPVRSTRQRPRASCCCAIELYGLTLLGAGARPASALKPSLATSRRHVRRMNEETHFPCQFQALHESHELTNMHMLLPDNMSRSSNMTLLG